MTADECERGLMCVDPVTGQWTCNADSAKCIFVAYVVSIFRGRVVKTYSVVFKLRRIVVPQGKLPTFFVKDKLLFFRYLIAVNIVINLK